jgi:hypothetical protein
MQTKLFDIKPIRVARPTIDLIDLTSVYFKMAEDINEWDQQDMNQIEFEEFVGELKEEFSCYDLITSDGYTLARDLERHMNINSNKELSDVMDNIKFECIKCLDENIEKWVKDCNITPKYKIEDEVKVTIKNVEYIGEITQIYHKKASYSIFVEELGHVKHGSGVLGVIKPFEDIEEDFFDKKHWKQ